jgi:hypothetical protein
MFHPRRHVLVLGLAFSVLGLTASAQDAKKEKEKEKQKEKEKTVAAADGAIEKALEQSKVTGVPILAVGGRET